MDTPEKELLTPEEAVEDFESIYASIVEEFGEKPEETTEEVKDEPSEEPVLNDYADQVNPEPPVRKDNSIRNLTILIILELLGIAGVAAWWIARIL